MFGSPAAKRAHAPLLALPAIPRRSYIRSPRPSGPYDRNAERRTPNRAPHRSPPPPSHSMPGPYPGQPYGPPSYYVAPAYGNPAWNPPTHGAWAQPGYYPQPYQAHPPRSHQQRPPGPRRFARDDSYRDRIPRQKNTPAELSTVHPSFTYKPPNFDNELRIAASPKNLYIQELCNGGVNFHAPATALRDKCNCSKCRDASSSQKKFRTTEIPLDLSMAHVGADEHGLRITYSGDIPRLEDQDGTHVQIYPWEELQKQESFAVKKQFTPRSGFFNLVDRTGIVHWDREIIANRVRSIDYADFIKGEDAMWDVMVDLIRYGLVFLRNVPEDPDSIKRVTTTIAPIYSTFYGETFDVRAKPNAENVAYTSDYLGLHQDLLYLSSTPQIQLLHCMENSCAGGESLFCDGDRIGRLLSLFANESKSVRSLAKDVIDHGYNANGSWYWRQKPSALHLNNGSYRCLWWSPPFEAPFGTLNTSEWTIRGKKLLETLLNEPETVYQRKMEPGECVLFDNRRVMHGRNAFDAGSGGSRWLRGAYIHREDFYSKATQMPAGYAEKSRDFTPIDVNGTGIQESLRKTQWYEHVRELIAQDQADADAATEKARQDRKFRQQLRENEAPERGSLDY